MNRFLPSFAISVAFFLFDLWLNRGGFNSLSFFLTCFQLGLVILTGLLWLKENRESNTSN